MTRGASGGDVRRRVSWVAAACVASFVAGSLAAQDKALEYSVKASYLSKLAPFVEWPGGAFDSPSGSITLCVVGSDPVVELAEEAAASQGSGGPRIVVRRVPLTGIRNARCQMLYVGRLPGDGVAEALAAVRGLPVLTVTDTLSDARVKGIVNFVIQDSRIRFEIDLQTAAENGLTLSSKLVDLAVRVRPRIAP